MLPGPQQPARSPCRRAERSEGLLQDFSLSGSKPDGCRGFSRQSDGFAILSDPARSDVRRARRSPPGHLFRFSCRVSSGSQRLDIEPECGPDHPEDKSAGQAAEEIGTPQPAANDRKEPSLPNAASQHQEPNKTRSVASSRKLASTDCLCCFRNVRRGKPKRHLRNPQTELNGSAGFIQPAWQANLWLMPWPMYRSGGFADFGPIPGNPDGQTDRKVERTHQHSGVKPILKSLLLIWNCHGRAASIYLKSEGPC